MERPIYNIPEKPSYNPTIGALMDSDPARAETVFNPLILHLICNIHAVKQLADTKATAAHNHDEQYEPLGAAAAVEALLHKQEITISGIMDDVMQLTFELAIKGMIDTEGMQHVVVDRFESVQDVNLISGFFGANEKKLYI